MTYTVSTYFDERAHAWDAHAEPASLKHEVVAYLAGVRDGARVLDVGCGTGIMARAILGLGAAGVRGIDVSPQMIACAREKFAGQECVQFECVDVCELQGEQMFDNVIMYNVYPHFADKQAVMTAVKRLLVPGGRFIVAHGMSRAALDTHHASVPPEVSSSLQLAEQNAALWREHFTVDLIADTPFMYFFGGAKE